MTALKMNRNPQIDAIEPHCALPGGEIRILGHGLGPAEMRRPTVHFGDMDGSVVISSDQFIVARVPEGASSGSVVVATNGHSSNSREVRVAVPIADSLHPVANPAVDADGNIYANVLRFPRTEGPCRHLSHRQELQRPHRLSRR